MNESKWQTGVEGDAMFEFVADRLSPRQWVFLSAAYIRKLWDLLPEGVLRQALDFAERAEHPLPPAERDEWIVKIDAAVPQEVAAAERAQREIVKSCDPDAADLEQPVLDRPTQIAPAFPLFQGASRNARAAIEMVGTAITESAQAVRGLFAEPNEQMFEQVRGHVDQANDTRTAANRAANNALRMKQEGDELADRAASSKNKRIEESIAIEKVRRASKRGAGQRPSSTSSRPRRSASAPPASCSPGSSARSSATPSRRRGARSPGARPPPSNSRRASSKKRAFDRTIILADALLDADCDEEAVLRHLRGTELGVKEQPIHVRGCWVIELILGRFEPLPPPDPNAPPRARQRDEYDLDIGLPFDMGEDRLA